MNGIIEIMGMDFRAFHGCLPRERKDGGHFVVDFSCEYDISRAAATDNIKDTLNYAAIYEIVAAEMARPSNLLENVAGRIASAIRGKYPQIPSFVVKVSKENPPVGGKASWASVTLEV